jgi:hypothetical protein
MLHLKNTEVEKYPLSWCRILLMDELTYHGNDPWIYDWNNVFPYMSVRSLKFLTKILSVILLLNIESSFEKVSSCFSSCLIGITPLEMAAYFGKPRVFNRLLVKTEESVIYKKPEKLQKLTKDGMECHFDLGKSSKEMNIHLHFEKDIVDY